MILPLRTRLAVVYTAVFGLLLGVIGLVSYRVLGTQLDDDATERLTQLTEGLHGYLRFESGAPVIAADTTDTDQAAFIRDATRYFQVFDANTGELLIKSDTLDSLGLRFTAEEVRAFREQPHFHDITTDNGRIRLSNSLISWGQRHYLVQVGLSLRSVDDALGRFLQTLLWGIPLGLIAAALAGRWLAGFALKPLHRLAEDVRTIDVSSLGRRVAVRGAGDELDDVARAFNDTLDRLDRAVAEMRQFSTAIAHELRTPLTALRGEIELSLRDTSSEESQRSLASQLEEIDTLKRLIDQILTLARAESGQIRLARDAVDMGTLCGDVVDQLEPVAHAAGVILRCDSADGAIVCGDRGWLQRLLLNLLDNAIRLTPADGSVVLNVAREDAFARIDVTDSGPGIPGEALPHVFERFFRADPVRSPVSPGSGLGLSLVKWIVERHNGRVVASNNAAGGATFRVWLPLWAEAGAH